MVEWLHVMVLAGLAVAQPIYDLLARHSGFFVVRRCQPTDILILAGMLSFLLPAVVAGAPAILRRLHHKTGILCHRLTVAVLVAALVLQALKRLPGLPGWPAVGLAAAVGIAAAAIYHRLAAARLFLSLLSPAIVVFPAIFLLHPSVSKILRPRHVEAIADLEPQDAPSRALQTETPVIFIIFDGLPVASLLNQAGDIDPLRFANFARLASGATWYRRATTVSADTIWAVPAILTGEYPDLERQPSFFDHPRNLFTLLGGSYRLELFEHLTDLCPAELCPRANEPLGERLSGLAADLRVAFLHVLLPVDLATSLPEISHAWGDFAAGDNTRGKRNRGRKFSLFLEAINAENPQTLYFLHSLFPHWPYQYLPSGKRYSRVRSSLDQRLLHQGRWSDDAWAVGESHRRHLLQVGMVDTLLGLIIERLRQTGLYDRSLIVVTADHGASFRPGDNRRALSETNFPDVMPVPLLIKRPRQTTGEIDDREVETIDILPTLADLLGIELPWPTDGASALDRSLPERRTKVCFGARRMEFPVASFEAVPDTVARAARAFGSGDFADVLRAGPSPDLVGRRLETLTVIEDPGGFSARLANPSLLREVDPGSNFVPALIEGFVEPPPELPHPLDLAIVVNGMVAATTRAHRDALGRGVYPFSSMVPETAFRTGTNRVEVLAIRNATLVRAVRDSLPALYAGVRLGVEQVPGVRESGFHAPEANGEAKFRWTVGAARLVVPVDPGAPPARLRMDIALTGKEDNQLVLTVAGRELFRGELPPGAWSRTFDLEGLTWAGEAVIEIASDTFVPKQVSDSRDARTLGVALAGIWLEGDYQR